MLLRDGDTLFFRRTGGQWYYRELLASIYYREEAAIVVGLLDHELPEISIYEASIGIPASTGSIGQATGTATKEYILREVSINVGLMLDERVSLIAFQICFTLATEFITI